MLFIWDPEKARANIKKHGISFDLAVTVFQDPLHLSVLDGKDRGEERWVTIGVAGDSQTLVVGHPREQQRRRKSNMKKEYNFKDGVRGQFYRPKKVQKTLRLDPDVLGYYLKLSHQEGIPYQTLINLTLRKFAVEGGVLSITGGPQKTTKRR